jgi:phenylacetate-CoA ligase
MMRHAFSTPLYRNLYLAAGISKDTIRTVEDLAKLPIVSKEDFARYNRDEIIPIPTNPSSLIKVSTSGTTGKSLSIYVNMYEIIMGLFGYLRTLREYGISWRKDRISIIGDFAPHTAESGYVRRGLMPNMVFPSLFNNIQWLDTNDTPERVLDELTHFKPDFIGGYVGMLGHLAVLKAQGHGKTIHPRVIAATGALLDSKLKAFIEEMFHTTVFEVYGATETGPIAFQCKEQHIYHCLSDFLHLEYLDEQHNPVSSRQPGHLVVTKLFGGGTPIIRYDAINDIVAPLYERHTCGLHGDLIDKIYGRDSIRLYRKDGKIVLASSLSSIFSRLLHELRTSKVRDMKVVQEDLDHIRMQLVLDTSIEVQGPTFDDITHVLKQGFKEKFGSDVSLSFQEVATVSRSEPRILSNVDPTSLKITGFI